MHERTCSIFINNLFFPHSWGRLFNVIILEMCRGVSSSGLFHAIDQIILTWFSFSYFYWNKTCLIHFMDTLVCSPPPQKKKISGNFSRILG